MTSEISIEMATTEVDLPSGTAIVNMRGFRQNGQKKDKETVIKAVLLGDYSVGKTTLFKRIREKELSLSTSWNSQSLDLCNLSIDLPKQEKSAGKHVLYYVFSSYNKLSCGLYHT